MARIKIEGNHSTVVVTGLLTHDDAVKAGFTPVGNSNYGAVWGRIDNADTLQLQYVLVA